MEFEVGNRSIVPGREPLTTFELILDEKPPLFIRCAFRTNSEALGFSEFIAETPRSLRSPEDLGQKYSPSCSNNSPPFNPSPAAT